MKSRLTPTQRPLTPAPAEMFQPLSRREPIGLMGNAGPPPMNPENRGWATSAAAVRQLKTRNDATVFIVRDSSSTVALLRKRLTKNDGVLLLLKHRDARDSGGAGFDAPRRVGECDPSQRDHRNGYAAHRFA